MTALRLQLAAACLLATVPVFEPARADAPDVSSAGRKTPEGVFLVKPYLQLGHSPERGSLQLLWHGPDASAGADAGWAVEYRAGVGRRWQTAGPPVSRRVGVAGVEPFRIYRAALTDLEPGGTFSYRVLKGGEAVFAADARAAKAADQPYRFVAFGDCGAGSEEQKPMAFRAYQVKPDFVMIPGDIVYDRGRVTEYRERFWPAYNADEASPGGGVPLLRSTLFVAAPGNHDIATRDLDKCPDGLAYFYQWAQPLNGPSVKEGGPLVAPVTGSEGNKQVFAEAAGDAFPRMANFSFDYGNAHWTVLDANPYTDWTDAEARRWVERDLAAARGATWRFVSFHQPGFNSSRKHFAEQHMRLLAPVFEAGKVDVVFNGHVHNYQRSYPLRFVPGETQPTPPRAEGKDVKPAKGLLVDGKWTLDKAFDGRTRTRPDGVIYLVTGGGGQHLYDPEQQDEPSSWQDFTYKFVSRVHSLTVVDVDGPTLSVRQVTADGEEVDRFTLTR